jgi:hypothetical protein
MTFTSLRRQPPNPHLMKVSSAIKIAFGIALLASSAFAKTPNIVVFISDDLGRLDTSIHGSKDARM